MLIRHAVVAAGLLAATVAGIVPALTGPARPHASSPDRPRPASPAPPAAVVPVLRTATSRVVLQPDVRSIVTVAGAHFEPGLTVTVSNPHYVFTFSGPSLGDLTPASLTFDGSSLNEGTYELCARNPRGRSSNVVPIVVVRK